MDKTSFQEYNSRRSERRTCSLNDTVQLFIKNNQKNGYSR